MTNTLSDPTDHVRLSYETDEGLGPNGQIGIIVTSNDQTLSHEARAMLNVPGVALYESRLLSVRARDGELSVDDLGRMRERIVGSARQINSIRPPDVVALGCTSGAMVIGYEALLHEIREVYPRAAVTDPLTGLMAALKTLHSSRICFISPYPRPVAEMMIGRLRETGYETPVAGSFVHETSNASADAPFISSDSIARAVLHLGRSEKVDTIFVSCTQLRVARLLDRLERELGKPVVTSNQALCWHALRLAGFSQPVKGWGSLMRSPLSPSESSS